MSDAPMSHRGLLKSLGKLSSVAAFVGASHDAARAWASRNVIPKAYWPKIVELARDQRIRGVTERSLALMSQGETLPYTAADFE